MRRTALSAFAADSRLHGIHHEDDRSQDNRQDKRCKADDAEDDPADEIFHVFGGVGRQQPTLLMRVAIRVTASAGERVIKVL